MQTVPFETLGLFEQLDRTVMAFIKDSSDTIYVSIAQEDFEKINCKNKCNIYSNSSTRAS
ncbi:hypothetical protein [Streptococcus constellatus]|uniref:hypothetical protein n=1 Tax=Streptococcus constellatus TaxID=76860 RepID=UPI0011844131|nr:hypothetical protein [Streptococcus constellatus]